MRGEYLTKPVLKFWREGSPPHARGIQGEGTRTARTEGITPACAGNTLYNTTGILLFRDHPRMRGEYELSQDSRLNFTGSPPHARGIPVYNQYHKRNAGITPACAGNTGGRCCGKHRNWDHPRMRGEYKFSVRALDHLLGSPPHARGIHMS